VTVGTVTDRAHDGDDLLNTRRIGRELLARVARQAASVTAGHRLRGRRCPAASSSTDSMNPPSNRLTVAFIRAEPLLPRENLAATASPHSRPRERGAPIVRSAKPRQALGIEPYEHDPQDEHWGFASWSDFFTRRFKDGARPVASPDDEKVIVSAWEWTPYGISTDVKRQDRFWIKSQPYSLVDMLATDDSVEQFVGGTVYQAFLSATD
jgi:hypothetical protein